jgi:hypothetical protein
VNLHLKLAASTLLTRNLTRRPLYQSVRTPVERCSHYNIQHVKRTHNRKTVCPHRQNEFRNQLETSEAHLTPTFYESKTSVKMSMSSRPFRTTLLEQLPTIAFLLFTPERTCTWIKILNTKHKFAINHTPIAACNGNIVWTILIDLQLQENFSLASCGANYFPMRKEYWKKKGQR